MPRASKRSLRGAIRGSSGSLSNRSYSPFRGWNHARSLFSARSCRNWIASGRKPVKVGAATAMVDFLRGVGVHWNLPLAAYLLISTSRTGRRRRSRREDPRERGASRRLHLRQPALLPGRRRERSHERESRADRKNDQQQRDGLTEFT